MISTLFAAGLLLIPSANAFWRLPCAQTVLNSRVDPIVAPGGPSSHGHTIMGSSAIGFDSTFADLRSANCSTCMVKDDLSNYWIPELFFQYDNGSFAPVSHGGMVVYYLQRNDPSETVEAFPDGLRMLAGDPSVRNYTGSPASQAISWLCLNNTGAPQTSGFDGNTNCPDGFRAQVFFPGCWDGVNLDSPDHKSHMAYPNGIDNGLCPPTHPHHLISIFYEVWFSLTPFTGMKGRLVLANGDPTGFGLHGDFMDGWDKSVLSRAVSTCTAASGSIEDCPVFVNENRFFPNDVMNDCVAPNPIPSEDFDPGVILPNLPGCVAITEGPAPAVNGDYVPGCTAVGVNGGGNAAPASSGVPSGAVAPSSAASSASGKPAAASSASGRPAAASSASGKPAAASSGSSGRPVASDSPASASKSPLSKLSSVTSGASGLPTQPANDLVASAHPSVSGWSSVLPTDAASSTSTSMQMDPDTTKPTTGPDSSGPGKGEKKGGSGNHCPSSNPGDVIGSHRRSRVKRIHGSPLSN